MGFASKGTGFAGQGTIEYLVLISAIIVFSLFVVTQGLGAFSVFAGKNEASARTAFASAEPFSIEDWSLDSNGVMYFVLKNNSFGKLGFNSLRISNIDSNSGAFYGILPGEEIIVTISPAGFEDGCSRGRSFGFKKEEIWIDYNTDFAKSLREYAPAGISGSC